MISRERSVCYRSALWLLSLRFRFVLNFFPLRVCVSFSFSPLYRYLVNQKWWQLWKDYVNYDRLNNALEGPPPGPINNSELLKDPLDTNTLYETGREGDDFAVVPQEVWDLLMKWYTGSPVIMRKVVSIGEVNKTQRVDLHPLRLTFETNDQTSVKYLSRYSPVKEVRAQVAAAIWNAPHKTRLYMAGLADEAARTPPIELEDDETLDEAGVMDGALILVQCQDQRGNWSPMSTAKNDDTDSDDLKTPPSSDSEDDMTPAYAGGNSRFWQSGVDRVGRRGAPVSRGLTGLSNLGNTCFMNSALQCLSHTMPLTRYILQGKHVPEINRDNPLGMHGLIADRYADLLQNLWSGDYTSVSPTAFKATLGKFAPQFSGFQQQDSQELLAFLLDGLHEDLNRVRKKPPVPQVEADDRPDAVVAKESWDGHLLRNRSVIVDLFQGQFKSTVVCPTEGCGRVSITFDPFMYLSAPLPIKTTRLVKVTYVPIDPSTPKVRLMVKVEKTASILGLKEELGKLVSKPAAALLVCDIYGKRIFKVMDDHLSVSHVRETDQIYVYEVLPPKPATEQSEAVNYYYVQLVNRRTHTTMGYAGARTEYQLFMHPLIVSIPHDTVTCAAIHDLMRELVEQHYLKEPLGKEDPLPYDACIARSHTVLTEVHNIRDDEVIFSCKDRQESLVVDWHPEGPAQIDDARVAATVDHPSMEQTLVAERSTISLQDCIELFTHTEKLSQEDAWYCNRCQDHVLATKKFDLWSVPEVLVIHLKRFQYTRHWREKISTVVDFPLRGLDMSQFIIDESVLPEDCTYDLFAVSNHSGGLGGGHYTAYVLHEESGRWYDCNDAWVSEASESSVVSSSAYLLFYRRRSLAKKDDVAQSSDDDDQAGSNDDDDTDPMNSADEA